MAEDLSNIAGMFRTNTEIVNRAIAGVPQEDWFRKPGNDSNHLMWVVGHLIVHRGRTLNVLGVDWNSSWAPLFVRGAERVADDEYPSSDEMRAEWKNVSTELIRAVREAPQALLDQSPPKGPLSFDGKLSGAVAFYAFHDAYHAGQVSYLRKWLGHGQTIG